MELYLQSVVPAEAVPSWKADALKAQAVAARTYAMYHKNGYRSSGYDVTDDTRSQVYSGISSETEATSRAVRETAGEIVTYGGKPLMPFSIPAAAAIRKTAKMCGARSFPIFGA